MSNLPRNIAAETTLNVPDAQAAKMALVPPAKAAVTLVDRCCVHEFWAVVERNGTLVRGRNVVSASRAPPGPVGMYQVCFTEDVTQGVYVATIGRPGIATEPAGEICVAARYGQPKCVWVDTHDSNGAYSDRAFHLIVHTD